MKIVKLADRSELKPGDTFDHMAFMIFSTTTGGGESPNYDDPKIKGEFRSNVKQIICAYDLRQRWKTLSVRHLARDSVVTLSREYFGATIYLASLKDIYPPKLLSIRNILSSRHTFEKFHRSRVTLASDLKFRRPSRESSKNIYSKVTSQLEVNHHRSLEQLILANSDLNSGKVREVFGGWLVQEFCPVG